MKSAIAALSLVLLALTMPVKGRTLALGDSLTFAYEAEFGFRFTIPFVGTYGDGFGQEVKNWVEILRDPVYRGSHFNFGGRDEFRLFGNDLLFRHTSNWSLPGLRISELKGFLEGSLTFQNLINADPDLALLLQFSDLDTSTAFELTSFEDQVRDTAERLVFFIGGNDVRGVYGTIYHGGSADAFIAGFLADAEAILDRVRFLNPDLPVVVVSVPHIGITPDIKVNNPTDPVATGRVTTALRTLNRGLKQLADDRGYAFADVFSPTLPLLDAAPFSIQGIPFLNSGSATGSLDFIWLNGQYSANFHPNTHGQAIIANEIIRALNRTYGTGIAPLTATEILGGLLGKTAAQIDMTFDSWIASYGMAGLGPDDDADGDGIPAGIEFALGLSPLLADAGEISSSLRDTPNGRVLELAYPERLPGSARYTLRPVFSSHPGGPYSPITPPPAPGADGLIRAWLPVGTAPGFLRLESAITP